MLVFEGCVLQSLMNAFLLFGFRQFYFCFGCHFIDTTLSGLHTTFHAVMLSICTQLCFDLVRFINNVFRHKFVGFGNNVLGVYVPVVSGFCTQVCFYFVGFINKLFLNSVCVPLDGIIFFVMVSLL